MLLAKCHDLFKKVSKYIPNIANNIKKTEDILKENDFFVAALTHDLKSPINAEITAIQLLIEEKFGKITKTQEEVLTNLLDSVKYMKHITDQISTFYKINKNGVTLEKEDVYFEDIVEDSISFMKFLPESKNQKIYIKKNILRKKIKIDTLEIKRVIHNLISNAVEYSPEYSDIYISISENSKNIIFRITDNGCGINQENIKNIFNEYVSLAKTQKKVGFGLGLNICKNIINAHSGTISLESSVGEGTSITFTLPK